MGPIVALDQIYSFDRDTLMKAVPKRPHILKIITRYHFLGKNDHWEFQLSCNHLGSGFFTGVLVGYAFKKVIKIAAAILGLFLTALAYLQYYEIATVNWDKLQRSSEHAVMTILNIMTHIPGIVGNKNIEGLALSSFGIPLTRSLTNYFWYCY